MRGCTKRTAMVAVLGAVAVVPAGLAAQDRCEVRDELEITGAARGSLEVDAGAGTLAIRGRDGIGEIRVSATLCASDRDRFEELDVSLSGDRIETGYPNRNGGWGRNYARIDLVVEVPPGTSVRVEDSSGSLTIEGVGEVDLKDGSGSMQLRDVGSVVIEDGSGSLRVEGVSGDIEVEDGSGSLHIKSVTGNVVVSDGSGSIRVEAVGGTVRIDEVGSGGVSVRDVDGDLVVRDGRRERIRYSDIRGSLDLPPARRRGRGN
ncbi:MAG: hypothetical protein OXE96_06370 [Gemmatimonadetes bacterium]|nr:hypothetical protein [Gemmatimonadota bacterium]